MESRALSREGRSREGCEHMCLADEDIPQRGRSRSKVEAAREEEALWSGRSLRFDHSRCYES